MNKNWLVCSFFLLFFSLFSLLNLGCSQTKNTQSSNSNHTAQSTVSTHEKDDADELTKKFNPEKAARLNVELGIAYLDSNQPARGKIKLQRALELAPYLPEVHVAFGRYFESIGEAEEAERSYLKAIKIDKNSVVSHNLYGVFLCRQGKYDKANKAFQKALSDKTYPESASILENAGLCELAAGNKVKARGYFEKAVRQDMNRANSFLELAYLNYEQNSFDMAWQLYNQYLSIAGQTPRSLSLGVRLARIFNYKDKEASYLLLLKNEYHHSIEYKQLEQSS